MREGYIVVREEKHIDDRFWVCEAREDALALAEALVNHWAAEYDDEALHDEYFLDAVFSRGVEDRFCVYVIPQAIFEPGERELVGA
jgi:hypothetical protein